MVAKTVDREQCNSFEFRINFIFLNLVHAAQCRDESQAPCHSRSYSQDASVVKIIIVVVFIYCIRLFDMGMCIISHLKFIDTQK